jgi:hypothetical protein
VRGRPQRFRYGVLAQTQRSRHPGRSLSPLLRR